MRRPWSLLLALAMTAGACGDDGGRAPDAAAFCARLDRLTDNDPFLAFGDTATAEEIEQGFDALVARADELTEVAPDDAAGAARDFAEAATTMRSVLAEADFDGATIDARAYRDAQLTYAEASERLLRYLDTTC